MTYDAKLARARELITKRDEIDAQLAELLGAEPRRGRPRKVRDAEPQPSSGGGAAET